MTSDLDEILYTSFVYHIKPIDLQAKKFKNLRGIAEGDKVREPRNPGSQKILEK